MRSCRVMSASPAAAPLTMPSRSSSGMSKFKSLTLKYPTPNSRMEGKSGRGLDSNMPLSSFKQESSRTVKSSRLSAMTEAMSISTRGSPARHMSTKALFTASAGIPAATASAAMETTTAAFWLNSSMSCLLNFFRAIGAMVSK